MGNSKDIVINFSIGQSAEIDLNEFISHGKLPTTTNGYLVVTR